MKNIKTFIIGFLSCACLFLIVGATKSTTQVGRYDIEILKEKKGSVTTTNRYFIFDTQKGEVIEHGNYWYLDNDEDKLLYKTEYDL